MTDRRYNEEEVSAIFARAAEEQQALPAHSMRDQGMTLVELQQIGREAGISPDAVANAARNLEIQPRVPVKRFLGLPIGVERSITLERTVGDAEWEQLVVQLRHVFNAKGRVSAYGNFREWTNGNLQALLEPTPSGHRLTLRTSKGSARSAIGVGSAIAGVSAVVGISAAAGGHLGASMPGFLILAIVGSSMAVSNAVQLPGWASRRGRQMDAIIASVADGGPKPELLP